MKIDWQHVHPSHIAPAVTAAAQTASSRLEELLLRRQDDTTLESAVHAIVTPVYTVLQASAVLTHLLDTSGSWRTPLQEAHHVLVENNNKDNDNAAVIQQLLQVLRQRNTDDDDDRTARLLLCRKVEILFGLPTLLHTTTTTADDDTTEQIYRALQDVRHNLQQHTTTMTTTSLLSDIYNTIGYHTEYLQRVSSKNTDDDDDDDDDRGTVTIADSLLVQGGGGGAPLHEHRALQTSLRDHVLPLVRTLTGTMPPPPSSSPSEDDDHLDALLRPTGHATSRASVDDKALQSTILEDRKTMLRLEQHVTLDGLLAFTFHLCRELFGLELLFVRKDDDDDATDHPGWHPDVMTVEVRDVPTGTPLGLLYLDLLDRHGKEASSRPVTLPLRARSSSSSSCRDADMAVALPMVCISLGLEAPTWEEDSTMVSWSDCEALLHEMGHAVQWICADSPHGCLGGAMQLPLAHAELLPHVSRSSTRAMLSRHILRYSQPTPLTTVHGEMADRKVNDSGIAAVVQCANSPSTGGNRCFGCCHFRSFPCSFPRQSSTARRAVVPGPVGTHLAIRI